MLESWHGRCLSHPPLFAWRTSWGFVMHTMRLGPGAVYDPDTLRTIGTVFENAWASIADNFEAGSRDPARLRLARIILKFAAEGAPDPLELKCRAIGAMQLPHAA
jgi:hypothetical protein